MKRLLLIFMTLCLVFGLSSVGTWAANTTWQLENPMSIAKDTEAVTVGDKIYVIGGTNSTSMLNTLEIYDTVTKTWSTGQSMPENRAKTAVSAVGNKIYVISGTSTGSDIKNSMLVYDTTTNTWSTGTSITTARWNACSVAIGTKIYVMGGNDVNGTLLNTVEIYDTTTGTWTPGTNMPTARSYFVTNVIDNKIYVTCGSSSTLDIFNTSTNAWSTGTPIPTNRTKAASALIDGKIYVIGGVASGMTNKVEIYRPDSNSWEQGPSLLTGRSDLAAAVINDKIYALGGYGSEYLKTMESLQVTPQVIIPDAPASLIATGGNSVVDLSWGAVSGATSYTVKRSTTAGGPYTVIAENVTGTTYSDTNVTNGTTYYYVVAAVNSAGSSANSNEASATPQAPASAGKALLVITMSNGLEKEYDLTMTEINAFINWYDSKAAGSGSGYYTFNKTFNLGPFLTRVDYITFDKIQNFEVMKYQ